jgi:4-hydroxy-tetrahydrodipicolinate reductase
MLKLAILGAGRMGRQLANLVSADDDCRLAGIWSRSTGGAGNAAPGEALAALLARADVAIDFTLAEATCEVLDAVLRAGVPLVCGVTGLDREQQQALEQAAAEIPLLYDRNMSVGIALLKRFAGQCGAALPPAFAAEIHETHHVHKIDAPSGTALMLGEALASGRDTDFEACYEYRPAGYRSTQSPGAIRYFVSRQGEVTGDHSIVLRGPAETITLSHSVGDRRVFAEGALLAARWLASQPAGRYTMENAIAG